MTLQKLNIKPGVNRERTNYSNEGTWYECDKVRFRQGFPEKIGGWLRTSANTFLGVCRSLFDWADLSGQSYVGVGTHLKFYVNLGTAYNDVTPLRATVVLTGPFTTSSGSAEVTVADAASGYLSGDYVTFSNATAVGGLTIDGEYQITASGTMPTSYTITAASNASSSASGGGTVTAAYQINIGTDVAVPQVGWGGGLWGAGTWGISSSTANQIRLWSQDNFGEDLVFNYREGGIYYWESSVTTVDRAVEISTLTSASDTPTVASIILVSDSSRFVFAFGTNPIGTTTQDLMHVRWSDQESIVNWTPSAANQAGGLRLSRGTRIIAVIQARQEILVWTDASVHSFQYVGAPVVWGSQIVGSNISIQSQNAVAYANGVAYWMGGDRFYKYDGRTQYLRCDVRRHVFLNQNATQVEQVFASTIEMFHEVWWFYCSEDSETVDSYVVYNYADDIWYYGSLARTAWLDSGLRLRPLAATYDNLLVHHEKDYDDASAEDAVAFTASITSASFDIDDGDRFSFISRVIPDVTFEGSTADSPAAIMTLIPKETSGSGRTSPASESGDDSGTVTRSATSPVEAYTDQVHVRVRGRQVAFKMESTAEGVAWQLGSPRIDIRPDGRRG